MHGFTQQHCMEYHHDAEKYDGPPKQLEHRKPPSLEPDCSIITQPIISSKGICMSEVFVELVRCVIILGQSSMDDVPGIIMLILYSYYMHACLGKKIHIINLLSCD